MSIKRTVDILKTISNLKDGKTFLKKFANSVDNIFEAPNLETLKKFDPKNFNIEKIVKVDDTIAKIKKEVCTIEKLGTPSNNPVKKIEFDTKNLSPDGFYSLPNEAVTKLLPVKSAKIKTTRRAKLTHEGCIARLQSGKSATIDDVLDLVRTQTAAFDEKQLMRILDRFPESDRPLVKKILQRSTQFGNMESLDDIAHAIKQIDGTLYSDQYPSLSASMTYFAKYDNYADDFVISDKSGCVIVDDLFLRRLESVPEYLEQIKANKGLKFIIPEGWTSGMNVFTQTKSLDDMAGWMLEEVKQMKLTHPNMSEDEIISYVLNNPVIARLKKLGINAEPHIVRKAIGKTDDSIETILQQLNGREFKAEDIQKILKDYTPEEQKYVLEILAHTLQIKSPKACSRQLKRMHHAILQAHGGTDKGVYYVTTKSRKSFSTVTAQYQYANDIDPKRILFLEDIENLLPDDARSIVVLDDMACSGDSLVTMYGAIAMELHKRKSNVSDIIIAPIMTSQEAYTKLNGIQYKGRYVTCIPGEFAQSLDVSTAKLMNGDDTNLVDNILDGRGYGAGGYSIAFPYMAPDNNSRFFARIANLFTLHGRGVKGAKKVDMEAITKEVQFDKLKSEGKPIDWAKIKEELKCLKDLKDSA